MNAEAIDLDHLRQWVGRTTRAEQVLDPFAARAMAALLDRADVPAAGDALPPLWHWLYFLDTPRRSAIGADGHPARGGFLPPVPLARRMWASGAVEVAGDLVLGRPAARTSTVRAVDLKAGRSGTLVFVTVTHEIAQDGRTGLVETQNLVYREAPTGAAPLPAGEAAGADAQWADTLVPDAPMLFRYSALTYNGHRIHYDADYARAVEFYPGLVVHGPLIATLMLDALDRHHPGARIASYAFRAVRPAFVDRALTLAGRADGERAALFSVDADGFVGMRADVRFAP